ncbi:glycoside hydrolase family 5 protein [Laccaria amethystina LaAM-08-1]|uniref:Glycoside hydrolase family 5 protein n=1 Tax=Laccaria amethystina LaAM-08-1 TaxID=1095629 RepID=A0A0C9X011_9AGAR|nr:glycoside hydrolase family 5 protein [Laccaria amethystina LaAM-08-1]
MQQMMNEPHRGYIQVPSLHAFNYNTNLHLSHVHKSNRLATHASLNLLYSFHLLILPVGRWPPHPRFNLDLFIPHAYTKDIDHSARYIQTQSMAA